MNQSAKKFLFCLVLMSLFSIGISAQPKSRDTFRVFFLGGQSNMEGFGLNKDLPADLAKPFKDVYIYHGNPTGDFDSKGGLGKWETLRPGHGSGFVSDGKTNIPSARFGIEMAFAKRMQELYPNDKIAIVKYARNGSSIDSLAAANFGCWEPDFKGKGDNQYDFFLKTLRGALENSDINSDGKTDVLIPSGILWMQGESDAAFTEQIANRYYGNLKRLMDLFRAALRQDDLPVVIGKISHSGNGEGGKTWKFNAIVQNAEEQFAKTDSKAAIVRSTSNYKYSDPYHYDSEGYLDLGKNFADAIYPLMQKK